MSEIVSQQISQQAWDNLQQQVKTLHDQVQSLQALMTKAGLIAAEEGVVGVYEGETMVAADGSRYPVPPNYASKTMLVSGDSLRMIEPVDGGQAKYKQIGKAERLKAEGLLAKKDGKFEVLTDQGSFKVLQAAVKHYEGEVGDTVLVQYAKQHVKGSWAAIEKIIPAASRASAAPAANSVSAGVINPAMPMPTSNIVQIKHAHAAQDIAKSESTATAPQAVSDLAAPVAATPAPAEPKAPPAKSVKQVEKSATADQASRAPRQQPERKPRSEAKPNSSGRASGNQRSGGGRSDTGGRSDAGGRQPSGSGPKKPGLGSAARPAAKKPGSSGSSGSSSSGSAAPRNQAPRPVAAVAPKRGEEDRPLPVDRGEILPMAEFDDDELM